MMNLRVECRTQERASRLVKNVLEGVENGEVQTWSCREIYAEELQKKVTCIYHDTEQTRNENKIACFHVYQLGTKVYFDMYFPNDFEHGMDVKLWLLGRLAAMLASHFYKGQFESIQFHTT